MELMYEGKSKRVFIDDESENHVIVEFTDNVTAGDGKKHDVIEGKGKLACELSEFFFKFLEKVGIDTHYVRRVDDTRLRCLKAQIFPVEIVCRNRAAGSFCKRYGIKNGTVLSAPLVEFFLKNDKLHDPLIPEDAIVRLGMASSSDVAHMKSVALSVNHYLSELFKQAKLTLVDFKLEFGMTNDERVVLADEISGDTIRVWNSKGQSYDKDLYRKGKGDITVAYSFLLEQLSKTNEEAVPIRDELVHVLVMPKDGIKNPPGEVTKKALARLGFGDAKSLQVGKVFEIHLGKPVTSSILKQLTLMSLKLLSNPISEKHLVRLDA
jgi:phosphoribosylaminoimidazole-succinocarboxamide synthase